MKTTLAVMARSQPQQGSDYPALKYDEIAALKLLHDDETLAFYGELGLPYAKMEEQADQA